MKRIIFILLILAFATPLWAMDTLTNTVTRNDFTAFEVREYRIMLSPVKQVVIEVDVGYDDTGFVKLDEVTCLIRDDLIKIGNQIIHSDILLDMPSQSDDPATYIMGEINSGTFAGMANASLMLEYAIKNSGWCNQ